MGREKLQQELSRLTHREACWFSARCALRVLPVLADRGELFPFWKKDAALQLISVFRAVSAAFELVTRNIELNRDTIVSAKYAKAAFNTSIAAAAAADAAIYASAYPAGVAANAAATAAATASATDTVSFTKKMANAAFYAEDTATYQSAFTDLLYLKNNTLDQSWHGLWQGQQPVNWHRMNDNLIKGLLCYGLDYWVDEYSSWTVGIFDNEKLERCLFMPESTIAAGISAILIHLKAEQLVRMAEARVVFLGEGEAGKTSLIRCLHGEEIREDEVATPRVEIRRRKEEIEGDDILVHYWDFGGQVIMHATHQFFLREKSVYVVVLDIRRSDDLEYWLDHVRVFASDAPTLIVLNKVDNLPTGMDSRPTFDIKDIRRNYPFVVDVVYPMSCKKSDGIEEFSKALKKQIADNLALSPDMPLQWFKVKEALAIENKDFIPRDNFDRICREQGVEGDAVTTALAVLDILGVAIHFPRLSYSDVVLNPEWITKAIYYIIWASEKQKLDGKLDIESLKALFSDGRYNNNLDIFVPENKCGFLLDLMAEFKLAFKSNTGENLFCVPMLAPTTEPIHNVSREDGLRFVFALPFLPPGLFYRFIAESGEELIDSLIWKTGAVLAYGESKVLVEYSDYFRHITFYAHGSNAGEYLSILRQRLMRMMGESYRELDYEPYIVTPDNEKINWRDMLVRYAKEGNGAKIYPKGVGTDISKFIQEYFGGVLEKIEESLKLEIQYFIEKGGFVVNFNNTNTNTVSPDINVNQTTNVSLLVKNEIQFLLRLESGLKEMERALLRFKDGEIKVTEEQEKEIKRLQTEICFLHEDIAALKAIPENSPTSEAEIMPIMGRIKAGWEQIAETSKKWYYIVGLSEKIDKISQWMSNIDCDKWIN
jgi:small GTP-binding protein